MTYGLSLAVIARSIQTRSHAAMLKGVSQRLGPSGVGRFSNSIAAVKLQTGATNVGCPGPSRPRTSIRCLGTVLHQGRKLNPRLGVVLRERPLFFASPHAVPDPHSCPCAGSSAQEHDPDLSWFLPKTSGFDRGLAISASPMLVGVVF